MVSLSFPKALAGYQDKLTEIGFCVSSLRAEIHIESMEDWSLFGDLDELSNWFLQQQKQCPMSIQDIPLKDCRDWFLDEESGHIVHKSGEFFKVQGIRVSNTVNREVAGGWDQPMMTQIGYDGGLLGILRKRFDDIPHYLIDAKAEPGNPDVVQISPTLQATFSNLKRAHKGRKPHFVEFFEEPENIGGKVLFSQWMSEDGGRLHLKRNKGMLVEIDEGYDLPELPSSFRWVSLFQLKELIKRNSWVNPHIRGIISHL